MPLLDLPFLEAPLLTVLFDKRFLQDLRAVWTCIYAVSVVRILPLRKLGLTCLAVIRAISEDIFRGAHFPKKIKCKGFR